MRTRNAAQNAYIILGMLFLFQTLNFFDKLVFGLSAVPMMRDLAITPGQFGQLGSAFFLLYAISGVFVGLVLTGRMRSKWLLLILALIWSAAQLPVYITGSLAVLAFCRILLGVGEGPGLPSALHAAYDWFPPARRSLPSAVILQGISAGFLMGGPLLTAIIVRWGWREAFLVCGVLGVAWAVAWSFLASEGPYAATPAETADTTLNVPARTLWLDRTVIGVILMSSASYYVVGMAATWLPPYLQLGLGNSQVTTGWLISAVFALQSPLLLLGGWFCQRMQQNQVPARLSLGHTSTAALAIAGAALLAAQITTGGLQIALIAIAFATPSLTTVFGPVLLSTIAPPAQRGRLIVVIYSGNSAAALLSTYGTGWIVDQSRPNLALGFTHAMIPRRRRPHRRRPRQPPPGLARTNRRPLPPPRCRPGRPANPRLKTSSAGSSLTSLAPLSTCTCTTMFQRPYPLRSLGPQPEALTAFPHRRS